MPKLDSNSSYKFVVFSRAIVMAPGVLVFSPADSSSISTPPPALVCLISTDTCLPHNRHLHIRIIFAQLNFGIENIFYRTVVQSILVSLALYFDDHPIWQLI